MAKLIYQIEQNKPIEINEMILSLDVERNIVRSINY